MSRKNHQRKPKFEPESSQSNSRQDDQRKFVRIVAGAGNPIQLIEFHEGDNVESILQRANIEISSGYTVALGRQRIDPKHLSSTKLKPNDTLVITGMPANG